VGYHDCTQHGTDAHCTKKDWSQFWFRSASRGWKIKSLLVYVYTFQLTNSECQQIAEWQMIRRIDNRWWWKHVEMGGNCTANSKLLNNIIMQKYLMYLHYIPYDSCVDVFGFYWGFVYKLLIVGIH
jgi:hypothetical protein